MFLPFPLAEYLSTADTFLSTPIDLRGRGIELRAFRGGVFSPGEGIAQDIIVGKLGDEATPSRIESTLAMMRHINKREEEELNLGALSYINVLNGRVEWKTGKLCSHSVEYNSTVQLPVVYDEKASVDPVLEFLVSVLPMDALDLFLEFVGYLLLPSVVLQKALLLTGSGSNGKSTVLELLAEFLGHSNLSTVSLHDLEESRFRLANLRGKLANLCHDLDPRSLSGVGVFKSLVSGDPVTAEEKFGAPFSFRPFARLIFSANSIPKSPDRTHAFYRRMTIINFPNRFGTTEKPADPGILSKLSTPENLSGLLNLAIEGLRRLDANNWKLSESDSSSQALSEYRKKNDSALAFAQECLERGGQDDRMPRQPLFDDYAKWCEHQAIGTANQREFNSRLGEELGCTEGTMTDAGNRIRCWVGLRRKAQ
jgi:putative DNA primase/helicase